MTCPLNDVPTPLGFPLTNTFGVTLSGGCPPTTLSTQDTLVGSIAKKRRGPSPRGALVEQEYPPNVLHHTLKSVKGENHGHSQGIRCGSPSGFFQKVRALLRTRNKRSPSFPNRQISATFSTPIPNTGLGIAPDFAMDTNNNFVVTATNKEATGATIQVYTKSIVELGGSPFQLASLAQGSLPCTNAIGQAQVMWDRFAGAWIFVEIAQANATETPTICLYAGVGK